MFTIVMHMASKTRNINLFQVIFNQIRRIALFVIKNYKDLWLIFVVNTRIIQIASRIAWIF